MQRQGAPFGEIRVGLSTLFLKRELVPQYFKLARKIRHKNVCGTHDLHEEGRTLYLTMEYVRGEDLKSLIKRTHVLTIGTSVSIARQVAEGLAEAHKLGIVHRDVSFKNVKENGLGLPLPAGVVRVYKADATGAQQFVGEDRIDHTPKDETVKLKIGNAFDVVCERKQTDFERYQLAANTFEMEYEITLRNQYSSRIDARRACWACQEAQQAVAIETIKAAAASATISMTTSIKIPQNTPKAVSILRILFRVIVTQISCHRSKSNILLCLDSKYMKKQIFVYKHGVNIF